MGTIDLIGSVFQIVIGFGVPIVFLVFVIVQRKKYKNRSNAGAFFFEDNNLVLNTGIPYAVPFDEVDHVELHYSSWELEHKYSYELIVKVIKKNGKKKWVFYKGYRTAKLALPSDMEAALQEKGLHCVMVAK